VFFDLNLSLFELVLKLFLTRIIFQNFQNFLGLISINWMIILFLWVAGNRFINFFIFLNGFSGKIRSIESVIFVLAVNCIYFPSAIFLLWYCWCHFSGKIRSIESVIGALAVNCIYFPCAIFLFFLLSKRSLHLSHSLLLQIRINLMLLALKRTSRRWHNHWGAWRWRHYHWRCRDGSLSL